MKKILWILSMVIFIMGLSTIGTAKVKKLMLVDINKGQMPNEIKGKASLSEENAPKEGEVTLKIEVGEDGLFHVGEYSPKKCVWEGFDTFKFDAYNPGKEMIKLHMSLRPFMPFAYNNRFDADLVIRPGKSTVEVPIAGTVTNDGTPIDWKKVYHWYIHNPALLAPGTTLYLGNFRLETEEEEVEKKPEEKK